MEVHIEKIQEIFNKELEEIKNRQLAMKNTITMPKNTLERTKSRIMEAKEWISELEDGMVEITEIEHDKEKIIKRNEVSLRYLQHNSKHYTYSNNI